MVSDKVPQHLSMRGSNSLRGGPKTYNAMCLNGNWYEDRLDPQQQPGLAMLTVPETRRSYSSAPGQYDTIYSLSYNDPAWKTRPTYVAPGGMLCQDQRTPASWTSQYREDFRNFNGQLQSILQAEKLYNERLKQASDRRHRLAAEFLSSSWPLAPEAARALCDERDRLCVARRTEDAGEVHLVQGQQTSRQEGNLLEAGRGEPSYLTNDGDTVADKSRPALHDSTTSHANGVSSVHWGDGVST